MGMVQEMNKIETMMSKDPNYTQSAEDFLNNWGISSNQDLSAITDLFNVFGGTQKDRKRRSMRVRRETCTCSGYSGSYFVKNKRNLVTACVGVAGFVQFF